MPWKLKVCIFAGYPMPQPLKVCIFAWHSVTSQLKVYIFTWYPVAWQCSWLLLWHPSSSWLLLADAGGPKPGNPWFEQLLMRKHKVFHDLINFTQKNSRIFAREALICQLYEGNLRLTSILTAFL